MASRTAAGSDEDFMGFSRRKKEWVEAKVSSRSEAYLDGFEKAAEALPPIPKISGSRLPMGEETQRKLMKELADFVEVLYDGAVQSTDLATDLIHQAMRDPT